MRLWRGVAYLASFGLWARAYWLAFGGANDPETGLVLCAVAALLLLAAGSVEREAVR